MSMAFSHAIILGSLYKKVFALLRNKNKAVERCPLKFRFSNKTSKFDIIFYLDIEPLNRSDWTKSMPVDVVSKMRMLYLSSS